MAEQRIVIGNAMDVLRTLDEESIDVCVTSPPYWSVRDYGTDPIVIGGDSECEHDWDESNHCLKCCAWKGQLGLEPDPLEYIEHLCVIFDEVKRVLKPTGSCGVNIGDTYASTVGGLYNGKKPEKIKDNTVKTAYSKDSYKKYGFRTKTMMQIPSRFAIAMTDHGWILRNEVIWHKPNVMPVSVTDRFTTDFEKFYFFTKEPNYYFKQIKEPMCEPTAKGTFGSRKRGNNNHSYSNNRYDPSAMGFERNARTVWSIPTQGISENHCAMYPLKLIDRPIRACCPPGGIVLDPFCGSGTTLEYCRKHDVNGLGIELNTDFKDMIERRMMKDIGKIEDFATIDEKEK